jgi:hypothetical protein
MYRTIITGGPFDLTDLLDIRDAAGEFRQMIPHDGPEFRLRALEHDEAAEVLQPGVSVVMERKR